jgi:hypothetical protein
MLVLICPIRWLCVFIAIAVVVKDPQSAIFLNLSLEPVRLLTGQPHQKTSYGGQFQPALGRASTLGDRACKERANFMKSVISKSSRIFLTKGMEFFAAFRCFFRGLGIFFRQLLRAGP